MNLHTQTESQRLYHQAMRYVRELRKMLMQAQHVNACVREKKKILPRWCCGIAHLQNVAWLASSIKMLWFVHLWSNAFTQLKWLGFSKTFILYNIQWYTAQRSFSGASPTHEIHVWSRNEVAQGPCFKFWGFCNRNHSYRVILRGYHVPFFFFAHIRQDTSKYVAKLPLEIGVFCTISFHCNDAIVCIQLFSIRRRAYFLRISQQKISSLDACKHIYRHTLRCNLHHVSISTDILYADIETDKPKPRE